jgi:hypothetical protein
MEDPALSVFSEARHEYMKQLSQYLRQPFLNFFLEQIQIARDEMRETPKKYLWQFQNRLKAIKEWNIEKVQNEITRIQIASNCDFLEELITAIFIAHTKVMTAIRISSRKSKVNITVPKLEHYLFKAVCECSDLLWANAFLFRDDISPIDKQKNMRQVESIILEGMQQAIRCLLPVKSILRDLVTDDIDNNDIDENDADDNSVDEVITKNNITSDINTPSSINKESVNEAVPVTEVVPVIESVSVNEETPKIESVHLPEMTNTEPIIKEETSDTIRHIENKKEEIPSEVVLNKLESTHESVANVEPQILQVDTSKKVQFSDYNMGFKNEEEETDPYFEHIDDKGFLILDDTEQAIDQGDFETL